MKRSFLYGAVLALASLALPATGSAQDEEIVVPPTLPADPTAAPTPFGPGEHLVYKVKVGIFNAGEGHMTMHGVDDGHHCVSAAASETMVTPTSTAADAIVSLASTRR